MRLSRRLRALALGLSVLALGACDGGTSTQTSFLPPPPPPQSPPPPEGATSVTILPQPVVGDFAVAGVWTNLFTASSTEDGRFDMILSDMGQQPAIRYTSGGYYEVKLPGEDYGPVVHDPNVVDPASNDPFLIVRDCCGARALTIQSSDMGFAYSAMASWSRPDLDFGYTTDSGVFAFGEATPAGAVPVTGNATYDGLAYGVSDAKTFDSNSGSWVLLPASGTVKLDFDFADGTLGGHFDLGVAGDMNPIPVGSYDFTQTVFSSGSTTYSGSFATSLAGRNFFNGLFTGPNAEETIGNWAVPFELNGETHQALGAWMAKAR